MHEGMTSVSRKTCHEPYFVLTSACALSRLVAGVSNIRFNASYMFVMHRVAELLSN